MRSKCEENKKVIKPIFRNAHYDIRSYGALGNGQKMNTEAFAQAMEACASDGGGRITVPYGVWLTGPIRFKSNVNLHLEDGAIILFSQNIEDYQLILSSFEGVQAVRCQSPLDGEGLENIAITGFGIFDGAGEVWRPVKRFKMTDNQWGKLIHSSGVLDKEQEIWWPSENAWNGSKLVPKLQKKGSMNFSDYENVRHFLRPNLLSFRKSKNILIDGPTFQNSPAWCLHPWQCEHVTIRNITVRNPWFSQNGDGLDLESCSLVKVENCTFDVGDDAICIKSGKNEEGRRLAKPCKDIDIRNCKVYSGHGGFVIGSEMSGGVKNVKISGCTFFGTDTGLRFKSTRGRGGTVENISIDKINMVDIKKEAIVFHMFYELSDEDMKGDNVPFSEETPIFRDIHIQNIICNGAETAILLKGLPEKPLQNLTFRNIFIQAIHGIYCSNVHYAEFINVEVETEKGEPIIMEDCQEISRR
ncbi:glycoside hydrolase family 28 protein [Sutcliffiella deserti]|uniref:glycoside hydrolase family 28 protein n=1 Tax=Sutcliffiella deserti TaxID=2875501 RepID=UPI001CBCCB16|nr:glycoside hydrolase family 28 protein [Sutcliffiella deserti]